jgi:hypothetical protein
VHTTNGRVTTAGADAHTGPVSIESTNGAISGSFNATGALVLRTTNAPITTRIALAPSGEPARAELRTTNGALDAELSLLSGSALSVAAHTTNDPLDVRVLAAPAGSTLALDARTTNARAAASLPPAFQGAFRARTSNKPVTLHTPAVADPRGKERARVFEGVEWNKRHTQVEGRVRWGDAHDADGRAVLETTNAPAELTI